MLRRDVIPVRRQPAQVGRPSLDQLRPPIGEVRRDLDPDVRHQPLALGDQPLDLLDRNRARPLRHRQVAGSVRGRRGCPRASLHSCRWRGGIPGALPPSPCRLLRDVRDLGAVVPRMRHEVLQDHLLEVPVAWRVDAASASSDCDPLLLGLADPDQDPAREGDLQLAGGLDRRQAQRRVLGRRAGVDSLHQPLGDRLQHQPLGGRHLAQPGQVVAVEDTEVGVRQHPPLEGPLAGPDDVGGEVLVAPLGQARGDLGVDLGPLAGEDQQLLGVALQRLVEAAFDLIGRVDVRPMSRERAVLAVALAGAGEGERVVAGEGDPSHAAQATATAGPARPGGSIGSNQLAGFVLPGVAAFGAGGRTRSGASVGGRPPGSSTNL